MIKLTFNTTDKRVLALLRAKGPRLVEGLTRKLDYLMLKLQQHIVRDKLSGQVLHHRTGKLARSVAAQPVQARGTSLVGAVLGASGEAWYGRLHEYGGTFVGARTKLKHPPHMTRRARGERVMTGSPYGVYFPERSFMRSALADLKSDIILELKLTVRGVLIER